MCELDKHVKPLRLPHSHDQFALTQFKNDVIGHRSKIKKVFNDRLFGGLIGLSLELALVRESIRQRKTGEVLST